LTNPLGIYGLSKLAGEHAIQEVGGLNYIFRTSWVYSNIGHNFYLTIKKLIQKQDSLRVINDQYGVPNSNLFLAEQISKIIPNLNKKNIGIYHLVCEGSCSWHTFAKAIASKNNKDYDLKFIHSILTNDFPAKALRPKNSILCNDKVKKTFG